MATRTKTIRSRGATATKRSEAATVKAGDRTGRTVGEAAKIEKESPQRTPKAATVSQCSSGVDISQWLCNVIWIGCERYGRPDFERAQAGSAISS